MSYPLLLLHLLFVAILASTQVHISSRWSTFYRAGVTIAELEQDLRLLEPFIDEYNGVVRQVDAHGRMKFVRLLCGSLARNRRIVQALDKKDTTDRLLSNLKQLLEKVDIKRMHEVSLEMYLKSAFEQPSTDQPVSIIFNTTEGFDDEVMLVLFGNTVTERTKDTRPASFSDVVMSVDQVFLVAYEDVIDEIAWLCVIRNCVNSTIIELKRQRRIWNYPFGVLSGWEYPQLSESSPILARRYLRLNEARIKVLFKKAFLERIYSTEKPDGIQEEDSSSSGETSDEPTKSCLRIGAPLSGVVIAAVIILIGYKLLYNSAASSTSISKIVRKVTPKISRLTTVAKKSKVGLKLTIFLVLVIICGLAFWYWYTNYVRKKDEDEGQGSTATENNKSKMVVSDVRKKKDDQKRRKQSKVKSSERTTLEKGKREKKKALKKTRTSNVRRTRVTSEG